MTLKLNGSTSGSSSIDAPASGGDRTITCPDATGTMAITSNVLFTSYAILEHQESDGTAGGTLTQDAWRTRPLNTEVADPDGIVSISSNQFTLQAGTYLIEWRMPGYNCETWQSRLQNITDGSTVGQGESHYTRGLYHQDWGEGAARVTISGAKAFEIQQYAYSTQSTNGMGFATSNSTGTEVYGRVKIYKEL